MRWRAKAKTWALLKPLVRQKRAAPTPAEEWLWARLRGDQLGVRFRRQAVIDRFIVDFYCPRRSLVVEVDGDVHLGRQEVDAARDSILAGLGLRVLHFRNEHVLLDCDSVIARIQASLWVAPTR